MKLSLANITFLVFAIVCSIFFGMDFVRDGHTGRMIAEGFVALFCGFGTVVNWNRV